MYDFNEQEEIMRQPKQTTTQYKQENGLKSINFCMPIPLLQELDWLKNHTGSTRSEMIRTGIRMYIMNKKNQLADQEKKELEAYHTHQRNQSRQVNTGLLPDF